MKAFTRILFCTFALFCGLHSMHAIGYAKAPLPEADYRALVQQSAHDDAQFVKSPLFGTARQGHRSNVMVLEEYDEILSVKKNSDQGSHTLLNPATFLTPRIDKSCGALNHLRPVCVRYLVHKVFRI